MVFRLTGEDGSEVLVRIHLGGLDDTDPLVAAFPPTGTKIAVLLAPGSTTATSFKGDNLIFDQEGNAVIIGGAIALDAPESESLDAAVERVRDQLD